jgi:hypothetical protein
MRAKARADRLKIITRAFERESGDTFAFAALNLGRPTFEDVEVAMARIELQREAESRAQLHGHQIKWTASLRTQAAGICAHLRCSLFVDEGPSPPIMDGEVFDAECLHHRG